MTARDLGILFNTDRMKGPELVSFTQRLDELGYGSVWVPELFGREPFALAGNLLAQTERITVATGIANVYARDAVATHAAASTLAELSPDRFWLGLGVSNVGLNTARGHEWVPPLQKMRAYLDAMKRAQLTCPTGHYPTYIAAHGPKLLQLAGTEADGANTYLMTIQHTAHTRASLGTNASLNTMTMCLLCEDPVEARRLARKATAYYMGLDYYHRAWRALGFSNADFENGGSDALIDALVAWGDVDTVHARIDAHRKAGATRCVIIPLNAAGGGAPDWTLLSELAS